MCQECVRKVMLADKLYQALVSIIGNSRKEEAHLGMMDWPVTGEDINNAIDVLKEYEKGVNNEVFISYWFYQ